MMIKMHVKYCCWKDAYQNPGIRNLRLRIDPHQKINMFTSESTKRIYRIELINLTMYDLTKPSAEKIANKRAQFDYYCNLRNFCNFCILIFSLDCYSTGCKRDYNWSTDVNLVCHCRSWKIKNWSDSWTSVVFIWEGCCCIVRCAIIVL